MKMKLALMLCLLSLMLTACGYWIVEDAPVQVGSSIIYTEAVSE